MLDGGSVGADKRPGLDLALSLHVDEAAWLGLEVVREQLPGRAGALDRVRRPVRLHSARDVDGVAPEVVEEASPPDHSGDDRAGADPDAKPEVVRARLRQARSRAFAHLEREARERL